MRKEDYLVIYLTEDKGFWGELFTPAEGTYSGYRSIGEGKVFEYDIENNKALIYYNDITPYWIRVARFSEYGAEEFMKRVQEKVQSQKA